MNYSQMANQNYLQMFPQKNPIIPNKNMSIPSKFDSRSILEYNLVNHSHPQERTWQNVLDDRIIRKKTTEEIIKQLYNIKFISSLQWVERFTEIAKLLEEKLYYESSSKNIYVNPNILHNRLKQISIFFSFDQSQLDLHNNIQKQNNNISNDMSLPTNTKPLEQSNFSGTTPAGKFSKRIPKYNFNSAGNS